MGIAPLEASAVAAIEMAEARAWADCYAAAPAAFAEAAGLGFDWLGPDVLALRWLASGRRYFSRVIGLGIGEPATSELLDEIVDHYDHLGIGAYLVQSMAACEPADYEAWLDARGLQPFDAQDRVVRGAAPLQAGLAKEHRHAVEPVSATTADEWAEFVQRVYRLDCGDWLQRLVGRPGWHPYIARDNGVVVAARTMHVGRDGYAWLGMDAPVPGLMTDDHDPDAAICAAIVRDGLSLGVHCFLADIEAPSDAMDTPAFRVFAQLGFTRPYVRTHHART
jgi:hypothetical protein